MTIRESKSVISRRRLFKFGSAAAAATIPWVHVRTAGAAGKVSIFFWDHWVPAGNDEIKKQIAIWSAKNKVEVAADFITSQGNQNLLTINAEAQAGTGHDGITIPNWTLKDQEHLLEPMDDVVGRLQAKYGEPNAVAKYLGLSKGHWSAVPSSWGTQNKGPAGRISILKELAGLDVMKMYPAANVAETPEAKDWTMDRMMKVAEACAKGGKHFGIGIGTTADSVDACGAIFAAFGAELVDGKGNIQIKSDACRQGFEYAQQFVKYLVADAQSFDDASNNRALISGNSAMIWNPPSAWAVATRDAPAVGADTWHFPPPLGPKGRFTPHSMNFWAVWKYSKNKQATKDLIEYLMQIENVDARSTAVRGYDLPPFAEMAESKVWDTVGPPVGTVYNYPVRKNHHAVAHLAHQAAPPEIAVQIYNRGTLPTMFAKLKAGDSIKQVIDWGTKELEGFVT